LQNTKRKLNKDQDLSSSWLWFKRNPNNPYKVGVDSLLHQFPKKGLPSSGDFLLLHAPEQPAFIFVRALLQQEGMCNSSPCHTMKLSR